LKDFEEIYRKYYPQIYFYLLGLTKSRETAEEITQETFFKVLKKIDTFRGDSSLGTWITEIAKNAYLNQCRKRPMEDIDACTELSSGESIEDDFIDKEIARELHILIHKLDEPYREVFWMRTFGELSFAEIGKIHGKTESWARVTYYRAKNRIREGLNS